MNSLPFISHRLYAAALNEENGARTRRRPTRALVELGASPDASPAAPCPDWAPGPDGAARPAPTSADTLES